MLKATVSKAVLLFLAGFIFYSCGKEPDIIYTNGKIYTIDETNTIVEAVAVKDGKILDRGTTQYIKDKYTTKNEIDLNGAAVLPGFIDAEGSLTEFSKNLNFINLSLAQNSDQIKSAVSEKVKSSKPGEWIAGVGWSIFNFSDEELQKIGKEMLDEVAPDNPVYLVSLTGNIVWVNSNLLKTVNITKETKAPEGGEIEVNDKGELTGLFFDKAVDLIRTQIPEISSGDMKTYLENGANEVLKYGITEVFDKTISEGAVELAKELADSNKFPVRLYVVLSGEDPDIENRMKRGTLVDYKGKITVRAVSLDYDGIFEVQDAAMNDQYMKEPFTKIPYSDASQIERIYRMTLDNQFQFFVKAVGDKAVGVSLETIGKVNSEKNPSDQRTVLEYAEFINPRDLDLIKQLKIIPSVRPEITMSDIQLVPSMVKPENLQKIGLWNSLLLSSGKIITGSDFPFHIISPLVQMYYLTTRQYIDTTMSNIPNPDQKLSLLNAVKSYTIWPAFASFQEKTKGSIEAEKNADMVVLSKDIFNVDPKELISTEVLMTIIDGKIVYDKSKSK